MWPTHFWKKLKSLTSSQRNVHFNTLVNPGRFDFSKKLDWVTRTFKLHYPWQMSLPSLPVTIWSRLILTFAIVFTIRRIIYFHHAFLQRGKFPCKIAFNKISHCVFQDHSTVIKEKHSCTCICSNKNGPIDFLRLFVFVMKLWFFNHRAAIVIIMNWEATFEYLFLNQMCLLKTVGEFFCLLFTVCVRWICSTCSKVTLACFQSNSLGFPNIVELRCIFQRRCLQVNLW